MRNKKLIIYTCITIIVVICIVFIGSWLYSKILFKNTEISLQNNLNDNSFFIKSNAQIQTYPLRNWDVANPKLETEIFSLSDIDTGFIYLEQNPDLRRPIASISKLMTALIAEKYTTQTIPIEIDEKILSIDGDSGNGLINGEVLKISELIRLMLLASSNKAAAALANAPTPMNFIDLMNNEAQELNMSQTKFADPSGLNMTNQSSVNDLKKLAKAILQEHPEIFVTTQEDETTIFSEDPQIQHPIRNINLIAQSPIFLKELDFKYLGGKTGFTDEAKQTFLGIFSTPSQKIPGQTKRILLIVLSSDSRYNDIETLLRWVKSAYVF